TGDCFGKEQERLAATFEMRRLLRQKQECLAATFGMRRLLRADERRPRNDMDVRRFIMDRTKIGYLVGGGLKENFRVRLTVSPQEIQEGAFVVIQSGEWNYYGIVTDIQLG